LEALSPILKLRKRRATVMDPLNLDSNYIRGVKRRGEKRREGKRRVLNKKTTKDLT
jgi:hypothetical protein